MYYYHCTVLPFKSKGNFLTLLDIRSLHHHQTTLSFTPLLQNKTRKIGVGSIIPLETTVLDQRSCNRTYARAVKIMTNKNTNNNDVVIDADVPSISSSLSSSATAHKVRRLFKFPAETGTASSTAPGSSNSGIPNTDTREKLAPAISNSATTPASAASSSSNPDATYSKTALYRDPITGRFTNDSNEYDWDDEDGDNNSNVVGYHELVPPESNGITPTVTYHETAPFYPVRYSCEGAVTANAVGNNGQIRATEPYTDAASDVTGSGTGTPPTSTTMAMVEVSAPVELEFLLPTSIEDVEANVDALQWSILKSLAERLGLSRRCDLDRQHNGVVLDGDSATNGGEVNEDQDVGDSNHSNLRRRRRNRRRYLSRKPRMIKEDGDIENGEATSSELQYQTSIYAVGSNPAVEWTGKFRYDP